MSDDDDIDAYDKGGWTQLIKASINGELEKVKDLVKRGADVNKGEKDNGSTPLYCASCNGHVAVVEYLLSVGADIEKPNRWENTPLMIASDWNKSQVVQILLKHHAHRDAKNSDGKTALDIAKANKYEDIIKLLTEPIVDVEELFGDIKNAAKTN